MLTKIKIAIENSGFKCCHLAKKLEIEETMFSHFVRGSRKMPPDKLKALAKLLRVSFSDLVEGERLPVVQDMANRP